MREDMNTQTDEQMADLGEHVRQLRQAKGMSVRGLAAQANVDATWLSRIERGIYSSPDPRNLWRLAQALDSRGRRAIRGRGVHRWSACFFSIPTGQI